MSTEKQQVSVSVDVTVSPEIVWGLISDLARMGEWSPECTGVKWAGAAPGPAGPSVGAVFKGKNTIGAVEPNRRIVWDIAALGLPVARWSYSIDPGDGGCRVTESWEDKRGALINAVGPLTTGVKDRAAHNEVGMRTTLERLKAVAEARAQ